MVDANLAAFSCWAILIAPLLAAALILCFAIHRKQLASALAIAGLLTSLVCTIRLFLAAHNGALALPFEVSLPWIAIPGLDIPFGVLIDQYSLMMTLVVTGVGSAIFIYATSYMHDDKAYSRFFGVLSLFAFSMLTIVLSNNWIQLFIGWELVGFSSYLLIGHWYAKPSAADAGKKAFIVNRVADFGFMLGILGLWLISGPTNSERTFHFATLAHRFHEGHITSQLLPLIGVLLFCGPVGKSAQFPLHVWLPDAMEGPTPVSALIHAATMVAAGVYMLCRAFWLFHALPETLAVIMWVGGITALLAACLALAENDLKRILAYSTLSQLGYMVMAVGLGGQVAGMYHLTTHAFFKALLFLGAGSVIHGTHEQDIWKLGGLWKSMRWTSLTFLIGSLALCGIWPLSGFFSKEAILLLAQAQNPALYIIGTLTAGLTAFYTARLWFVAFTGKSAHAVHSTAATHMQHGKHIHHASHHDAHGPVHESGPVMLIPLFFLAILSVIAGFIGIPRFLPQLGHTAHGNHVLVTAVSMAIVFAGIFLSWLIYKKRVVSSDQIVQALALPYSYVRHGYYFNEFYNSCVAVQQKWLANACEWLEENILIRGLINGIAYSIRGIGSTVRLFQTGRVQTYALVFLLGVVWLLSNLLRVKS